MNHILKLLSSCILISSVLSTEPLVFSTQISLPVSNSTNSSLEAESTPKPLQQLPVFSIHPLETAADSLEKSTLDPTKFWNTAFNFNYPFLFEVPPLLAYILSNDTLKNNMNFTFNSPYANEPKTLIGDTEYFTVNHCGIHFINKGDGYIINDQIFTGSTGSERCTWAFVGSQFCTPSVRCPRFAGRKGSCLTNYLQITDGGESFVLHFCEDTDKPKQEEYVSESGLMDITLRFSMTNKMPNFECYVTCVNYKVNFTTTGSVLDKNNTMVKVKVHETKKSIVDTIPEPRRYKSCKCGVPNGAFSRSHRIVGGRETLVGQYPWTLGILSKFGKLPYCGASLINDRYVLTASHCVEDEELEDIVIVLNEHDFFNDTETVGKTIRGSVAEVIQYHYYLDSTFYGDLALLRLSEPVDITNFTLTPICLPRNDNEMYEGREVVGAGWGTTKGGPEGVKSPKLMEVPLVVYSNEACNDYHGHTPPEPPQVTDNMLCAGYSEGGRDTCAGDSGGPLIAKMKETGRYAQVGITSWGFGCAIRLNPGVFSRVTSFLYWIRQHTVDAMYCM